MTVFFLIIISIVGLTSVASLSGRIRTLEKKNKAIVRKLYALEESQKQSVRTEQAATLDEHAQALSGQAGATSIPRTTEEMDVDVVEGRSFADWIKDNWLQKVGVLFILIGFGWFISYAFVHNWIGPIGRVTLGLVAGALLASLGSWRFPKDVSQGTILIILGSAIAQMTLFASRAVYDFFSPTSILVLSFVIAAYVAVVGMKYHSEKLALYGGLVALIAPMLTDATKPFIVGTFMYLLVVVIGGVWVSIKRGWHSVNVLSIIATLLYLISYSPRPSVIGDINPEAIVVFMLVGLLALIYFFVNVFTVVYQKIKEQNADIVIAITNAITILASLSLISEEYQSLVLGLWVIVFGIGSFIVAQKNNSHTFFYIYSLIAALFLGIAFTIELEGPTLYFALIAEATAVVFMTHAVTKRVKSLTNISVLMVVPFFIGLMNLFIGGWYDVVPRSELLIAVLSIGSLLSVGIFIMSKYDTQKHDSSIRSAYVTHIIAAVGLLFILIWQFTHTVFSNDFATIVSLTIYTLIGIVTYVGGFKEGNNVIRYFGNTVLILVVARLLLIDVWNMDLALRIVMFIVIGILLVSTAFMSKLKKTIVHAPIDKVDDNTQDTTSHIPKNMMWFIALGFALSSLVTLPAYADEQLFNTEEVLQSFQSVTEVTLSEEIVVPTVVDIAITDERYRSNSNYGVYNETTDLFEPYVVIQEKIENTNKPTLTSQSVSSKKLSYLVDKNTLSAVDFLLKQDSPVSTVEIVYVFSQPISTNQLQMQLDSYVSLPQSVQITAEINGNSEVVLSKTRPVGNRVTFPEFRATKWKVVLEYVQPLRFSELNFVSTDVLNSEKKVRFLAQPENDYLLYVNPEIQIRQKTKEAPRLSGVPTRDIVLASTKEVKANKAFAPADSDADGVPDHSDNCVNVSNKRQEDVNNNGRGDACEDFDQDGVSNHRDNCLETPNRYQEDIDGDGKGDACDSVESRITEKHTWLVWLGLGTAAAFFVGLLIISLRKKPTTVSEEGRADDESRQDVSEASTDQNNQQ